MLSTVGIFVPLCVGYGLMTVFIYSKWTDWRKDTTKQRLVEMHPKWKFPSNILSENMLTTDEIDNDTCTKIIQLDESVINRTVVMTRKASRYVMNKMTNCDDYFRRRNYINSSLTDDELSFPIAYSVLIYTEFDQFESLLEAIWRPQNLVCVHVDKKSPLEYHEAVVRLVSCFGNVFVASRRIPVFWGQFSVLEADLTCMRELWGSRLKWRYFINLTGQEFPLKTNLELIRVLRAFNGTNDIFGWTRRAQPKRWAHLPPPPHNITPMKGPVHIIASRAYVDYVLHNAVARDFLDWAKKARVPDETFFATLNNNVHLGVPGQFKGAVNLRERIFLGRHKIWRRRPVKPCGGKYVHSVCVFGARDLQTLTSSKCLFANKLHYDYEPIAYECLRIWYFGKVQREMEGQLDMNVTMYRQYGAGSNPQL